MIINDLQYSNILGVFNEQMKLFLRLKYDCFIRINDVK